MSEILLTRGFVALVDDEDYERLRGYRWFAVLSGDDRAYAVRHSSGRSGPMILMHREIVGAGGGEEVDHKRHYRALGIVDNRRSNLRKASTTQNHANRSKTRGRGTSRYKGVALDRRRSLWRAQIMLGEKQQHLGRFPTEALAARAYDVRAVELHGEFALTNFPVPGSKHWLYGPGDLGEGSAS